MMSLTSFFIPVSEQMNQPQHLLLILPHQRIERRPRSCLSFADELHLGSPRLQTLLRAIWSVHCS